MDRKALINFLKQTVIMEDSIALSIASKFKQVLFSKNDFILKQGQISNEFIFLETGFIRAFTFDPNGNDVTTNFYNQNIIVFEVASYFKRTPTNENFQALNDCICWIADYDTMQTLFHSSPEFREFGRSNLVNGFIAQKERAMSMINHTAEQRYEHLIKTRPDIFQIAQLKHIASFLGITDTSLSRIRKEIMQK